MSAKGAKELAPQKDLLHLGVLAPRFSQSLEDRGSIKDRGGSEEEREEASH